RPGVAGRCDGSRPGVASLGPPIDQEGPPMAMMRRAVATALFVATMLGLATEAGATFPAAPAGSRTFG
ncbi:MAG: hypothetical protein ACXWYJ_12675, partial [Actinomycetota bacterium]